MEIKGLKLPNLFIEDVEKGNLQRAIGSWQLRSNIDAYGNHLETDLGFVYDFETIIQETNNLPKDFALDGFYAEQSEWESEPGFIPDIIDFSQIVCFGISGDGAPFCFDFRDDLSNPNVIWWDDVYWRRIAPSYKAFKGLLDFKR